MSFLNRAHFASHRRSSGWQWLCLATVLLFAFQVTYVRIHLLTELHHGAVRTMKVTSEPHTHNHSHGHDEHHHHDEHQPHSAEDHELQLATKRQISVVAIDVILPVTKIFAPLPEPQIIRLSCEPDSPPGESPPDPLQPRAPPIV